MLEFAASRFVNWQEGEPILRRLSFRRLVLELWAMFVLACAIGFIGPFGTYVRDRLADRVVTWGLLLMGAYLLVRPAILALPRVAAATELSAGIVAFWGVTLCSVPLAALWRSIGRDVFRELDGFAVLLPYALLCALAVLAVARWAEVVEGRLRLRSGAGDPPSDSPDRTVASDPLVEPKPDDPPPPAPAGPPLLKRLPPGFAGPIVALQSEDHYVRVHGPAESVLVLMRLRDAVAEMGGAEGEQVHRSWWVARSAVAATERAGRSWVLRLSNGAAAPIARESVERLRRSGFLAGAAESPSD